MSSRNWSLSPVNLPPWGPERLLLACTLSSFSEERHLAKTASPVRHKSECLRYSHELIQLRQHHINYRRLFLLIKFTGLTGLGSFSMYIEQIQINKELINNISADGSCFFSPGSAATRVEVVARLSGDFLTPCTFPPQLSQRQTQKYQWLISNGFVKQSLLH